MATTTQQQACARRRPAGLMVLAAAAVGLLLVLLQGAEARGAGMLSRTLRRPLQRQVAFLLPKTGPADQMGVGTNGGGVISQRARRWGVAVAAGSAASVAGGKAPENVVIIGSGPAGYTAAIYCARANLKPVVFEGASAMGGQLMSTTEVENFPGFPEGVLGPDLMMKMRKQAVRWGSEMETDDVSEVDLGRRPFLVKGAAGRTVEANSVIVATGALAKRLNLPSENAYWSKGVTACAICDGAAPIFRDEPLAVVGGGDSAAEEAVYLTKYSPKIHLLVRSGQMRASKALQDRVLGNRKITVHYDTEVVDILGDDPDKPFTKSPVRSIKIKTAGAVSELPVRGVFYAIGHDPNTALFKPFVDTDSKGYITVKPGTPETSLAGVFAAGDVQDPHWRQAVTAAGSGCMAALAAERYLSEKGLLREVHQPVDDLARTKPVEANDPAPAATVTMSAAASTDASSSSAAPTAAAASASATGEGADDTYHKGEEALKSLKGASPKPILVMFMSKTCGPCRILKPILSRVLKEYEGRVHYVEIDIEEYPELTLQSSVAGTPTVQIYTGEELLTTLRGVKKSSEYKSEIDKALDA